ncbi:hypothetical protein DPMN_012275 [Dreissena polymorpha]|uniref:Uncharacterized protein n=1 Tax=Dreissena polymorpha TaxID=45954 RepID=A0A9D4N271_DREPO|nr:hypothetical protein DPMN_012275 [Dreissena polymorpha]
MRSIFSNRCASYIIRSTVHRPASVEKPRRAGMTRQAPLVGPWPGSHCRCARCPCSRTPTRDDPLPRRLGTSQEKKVHIYGSASMCDISSLDPI